MNIWVENDDKNGFGRWLYTDDMAKAFVESATMYCRLEKADREQSHFLLSLGLRIGPTAPSLRLTSSTVTVLKRGSTPTAPRRVRQSSRLRCRRSGATTGALHGRRS